MGDSMPDADSAVPTGSQLRGAVSQLITATLPRLEAVRDAASACLGVRSGATDEERDAFAREAHVAIALGYVITAVALEAGMKVRPQLLFSMMEKPSQADSVQRHVLESELVGTLDVLLR
jgi:hypothetical protein